MGSTVAAGIAQAVGEGYVGLETALGYHLQVNHYPPLPGAFVGVALEAISNVQQGDWGKFIPLPNGISHRVYGSEVPTHAVVEFLHLQAFLTPEEDA